jgi:hypothetical protein
MSNSEPISRKLLAWLTFAFGLLLMLEAASALFVLGLDEYRLKFGIIFGLTVLITFVLSMKLMLGAKENK